MCPENLSGGGTISRRNLLSGQFFPQLLRGQLEELPETQLGEIQAQQAVLGLAPNKLVVWCYNRFASFRSNDGGEPWSPSPITEPSMSAVAPIANEAGEAPSSRSIGPSINWSPSWMRSGVGCSPASGRRSTVGEGSHGWRSSPG